MNFEKTKKLKLQLKHPLVSVLMSAYNAEKYIEEAIQSVLNQSYSNIELIVVNDGSTDQTSNILKKFQDRIFVYEQTNQGQCAALNTAYEKSNGTLIKFFDSDDILSSEFIELQVNRLIKMPNCIASAEWVRFFNNNLMNIKLVEEKVWKDLHPIDWLVTSLESGVNMMQCALWLIPRKILEQSGLWDERLSLNNDIEFFTRVILKAEKILFTPGARLYYRSGIVGSLSSVYNRKTFEAGVLSNELAINYILNHENSNRTRRVSANILRIWQFQSYPHYKDITKKLEQRIQQLGGSKITLPGGKIRKYISYIIGWKFTTLLNSAWIKIRYK